MREEREREKGFPKRGPSEEREIQPPHQAGLDQSSADGCVNAATLKEIALPILTNMAVSAPAIWTSVDF